jgi:hypothetical protein
MPAPRLDADLAPYNALEDEFRPLLGRGLSSESVMGTVTLTDGDVVYIPPATSDPQGLSLIPPPPGAL